MIKIFEDIFGGAPDEDNDNDDDERKVIKIFADIFEIQETHDKLKFKEPDVWKTKIQGEVIDNPKPKDVWSTIWECGAVFKKV